jgi:hypothetical protein
MITYMDLTNRPGINLSGLTVAGTGEAYRRCKGVVDSFKHVLVTTRSKGLGNDDFQ